MNDKIRSAYADLIYAALIYDRALCCHWFIRTGAHFVKLNNKHINRTDIDRPWFSFALTQSVSRLIFEHQTYLGCSICMLSKILTKYAPALA